MTAHFVIALNFGGVACHTVEFSHECNHSTGRRKQHHCVEIPDDIAALPLDQLIKMWKAGIRPKPHHEKPQLTASPTRTLPQPKNEMG